MGPRADEHEGHMGPRADEHEGHMGPRADEHEGHMGPRAGGPIKVSLGTCSAAALRQPGAVRPVAGRRRPVALMRARNSPSASTAKSSEPVQVSEWSQSK